MTFINVGVILFFIVAGAFHVKPANWKPFFPYGMAGCWAGVGKVFFSYIGFDSVSTLAGEVRRPERDLPIGIVGTLLVVTMLYVVVALVLTGMLPYHMIDVNAPLSKAFESVHTSWAAIAISFGSITVITATTLVSLVGQPRIFYQMSKDGLMFKIFGKVNRRTGVPVEGTIITGLLSAVIALFLDLNVLINMISIGTLLAFTVVCGGVVILRYEPADPNVEKSQNTSLKVILFAIGCIIFATKQKVEVNVSLGADIAIWLAFFAPVVATFIPLLLLKPLNIPSTFKCPLVPFIPCLGILMNIWFILSLDIASIYRLIVWTFLGMLIYIFYGIRNSALIKDD